MSRGAFKSQIVGILRAMKSVLPVIQQAILKAFRNTITWLKNALSADGIRAGFKAGQALVTSTTAGKTLRGVFNTPLALISGSVATDLDPDAPVSDARKPILVGAIILGVMVFGVGLWAALAPIGSASISSGMVVDELGRQTIQHLEGGIVKEIPVQEGDHVKAGDVLIRLDDTRARAELDLIQGQLDLADATQARLLAERDGRSNPEFPAELLARANDPQVAEIIAGQTNFFNARAAVLNGQKGILQKQIDQYQEQVNGYKSIEVAKDTQLKLVQEELRDIAGLLKQGYVTKSRVLALQREEGQLLGDRGQAQAEIARAEQGIGESNRQILQLDNQRQQDVSQELHTLEGQLNDLKQKLIATQDVVRRLNVVSPIDGTVTNLAVHTIGGVIPPGFVLMEVVPANDRLIVESQVNPIDVNAIHVGDEVAIRVIVAGGRLTPTIYGRLEDISADRITIPNSNQSYYKARISISPEQAARLGDIKLKVGMPVEAMISTGSQSALHYMVKPFLDSFNNSFREK